MPCLISAARTTCAPWPVPGGNKICTEINAYVCLTTRTLGLRLHARGHVYGRIHNGPQTACPRHHGAYIAVECTTLQGGENLPTGMPWKCTPLWLPSRRATVGPHALASWRRRRPHLRSRRRSRPRRRRRPRPRRRRRPRQTRRRRRAEPAAAVLLAAAVDVARTTTTAAKDAAPPSPLPYPPPPPLSPGYTFGVYTTEASQGYEAAVPISTTDTEVLALVRTRIETAFPMILDDVNITVTLEEAATGRRLQTFGADTSTCTQDNVYVATMTLTTFNQQIYDDLRNDIETLLSLEDSTTSEGGDQVSTRTPAQVTALW